MKGFTAARRSNTVLLGDIQQYIVANAMKHGQDGREPHKIHVSEITKKEWCPRQSYYKLTETPTTDTDNSINHRSETFFDTGHEAHRKWQDWLWGMGVQWGTWKCLNHLCEAVWEGTSPRECPTCQGHSIRYEEVPLEDLEYHLVGHGDGAHRGLNAIIEFKGIGNGTVRIDEPEVYKKALVKTEDSRTILDVEKMWKTISRPFKSHLTQVMIYLWMCKRRGLPFDKAILIYESKANQATKEFVVPYTPRLIEPLLARLKEVVDQVERKELPDRPDGFEKDKKPCSNCLFRSECWEVKVDASQEETPGGSVPTGRRLARRKTQTGEAADLPAAETTSALPTDPQRHHRLGRRPADAAVHAVDPARGVPQHTVGVRRSR